MDHSPPGSSVHGISLARLLEWVAISYSRESSRPRDRIHVVSCVSTLQADSLPLSYRGSPSFSTVQFSRSVVSDSLRPHELQRARPPCPTQTPGVHSDLCPSRRWCHPAISSSVVPFSSCPQSLPASGSFPTSQFFAWGDQKVLEFQLQHRSFRWTPRTDLLQDGLVGSPCSPRNSQESSPTPQFKSINFSVLSFLHSPTLTSIHDHWKNHSFD